MSKHHTKSSKDLAKGLYNTVIDAEEVCNTHDTVYSCTNMVIQVARDIIQQRLEQDTEANHRTKTAAAVSWGSLWLPVHAHGHPIWPQRCRSSAQYGCGACGPQPNVAAPIAGGDHRDPLPKAFSWSEPFLGRGRLKNITHYTKGQSSMSKMSWTSRTSMLSPDTSHYIPPSTNISLKLQWDP